MGFSNKLKSYRLFAPHTHTRARAICGSILFHSFFSPISRNPSIFRLSIFLTQDFCILQQLDEFVIFYAFISLLFMLFAEPVDRCLLGTNSFDASS